MIQAFAGKEKERFVFINRTADRTAELLAIVRRLSVRIIIESVSRIESSVAKITESAAVQTVAAGFGNDIDNAARRAAEFGVVAVAVDLKFLYGFLADDVSRAARRRVGGRAVDVDRVSATVFPPKLKPDCGVCATRKSVESLTLSASETPGVSSARENCGG